MVLSIPAAAAAAEIMETREASPAHFLIKIESFSLFDTCGIDKYETKEFVAGEYKWKLIIYPNGDKIGKDSGHISVHLAIAADTSSLPANWEVNAVFSIFLFNQICNDYTSLGITRRFLSMKSEWGFSKFISKEIFSDPSNGYLVDDNCVFGAEVFVIKSQAITECLTLKSVDIPDRRDWIIPNLSSVKEYWSSEEFSAGGHKWKVSVYPKGVGEATGRDVSVFLHYVGSKSSTPSERVQAKFTICIKNQLDDHKHNLKSLNHWFTATDVSPNWGWLSFIKLATINDPKNGFVVKDSCLLDVKITVQAVVRESPLST